MAHPRRRIAESHVHAEVGELLSGAKPGRTSAEQVTLYKSVGVAVQDAVAARLVLEKARDRGMGTEVALEASTRAARRMPWTCSELTQPLIARRAPPRPNTPASS